ncbi:hypothetical protein Tco_0729537 [Tanacetum coccineum]|uniref:Uncharacterized protein n=1 Tax=Tanacetum coccineum TaxID=301880 RepID=A0ABQ4YQB6_9ASTR
MVQARRPRSQETQLLFKQEGPSYSRKKKRLLESMQKRFPLGSVEIGGNHKKKDISKSGESQPASSQEERDVNDNGKGDSAKGMDDD